MQGVLREKARYMVNHLVKTLKEIDSPTFKARAMIVTEGRKRIYEGLFYTKNVLILVRHTMVQALH